MTLNRSDEIAPESVIAPAPWDFYLAFCEVASATHALDDAQLVLNRA